MTTNKPKVVAYTRTGALASILPHPWRLPIVSDWSPMYSDALIRLSDYEELQAECEQLRKDAEKYRWLTAANSGPIGIVIYDEDGGIDVAGPQADEVIDAAMAGGSQ